MIKKRKIHLKVNWWKIILFLFFAISLLHKFIANDIPIIGETTSGYECLVCQDYLFDAGWIKVNPRTKKAAKIIQPIINRSPNQIDYSASLVAPFNGNHWLGTDSLGRDVLAGLIHGCWKAFLVGIFSIGLAFLIALLVGGVAGYWNGEEYEDSILGSLLKFFIFIIGVFYITIEWNSGSYGISISLFILMWLMLYIVHKELLNRGKKWKISPARIMDRLIELREVIPGIFLLLASLSLFSETSIWNVVIIIGFIAWSSMARYIRAEIMNIKSQNYYKSARAMGLNHFQLIKNHIMPNALDPIYATVAFAISSAILLEASLSFLGIGVPPQEVTWGAMLAESQKSNAWWLALFPGISIFLTIIAFHNLSNYWRKRHH